MPPSSYGSKLTEVGRAVKRTLPTREIQSKTTLAELGVFIRLPGLSFSQEIILREFTIDHEFREIN
jgi:hypothetical protein